MYHIARIAIGTETGDMVCRPYDGLGLGLELGFRAEIRVGTGIIGARTFPPDPTGGPRGVYVCYNPRHTANS